MVMNFTNIYKTKESLNSDGHEFHQYLQNEQYSLIITELTEHKNDHGVLRWK
jgi:hypothetical protein